MGLSSRPIAAGREAFLNNAASLSGRGKVLALSAPLSSDHSSLFSKAEVLHFPSFSAQLTSWRGEMASLLRSLSLSSYLTTLECSAEGFLPSFSFPTTKSFFIPQLCNVHCGEIDYSFSGLINVCARSYRVCSFV